MTMSFNNSGQSDVGSLCPPPPPPATTQQSIAPSVSAPMPSMHLQAGQQVYYPNMAYQQSQQNHAVYGQLQQHQQSHYSAQQPQPHAQQGQFSHQQQYQNNVPNGQQMMYQQHQHQYQQQQQYQQQPPPPPPPPPSQQQYSYAQSSNYGVPPPPPPPPPPRQNGQNYHHQNNVNNTNNNWNGNNNGGKFGQFGKQRWKNNKHKYNTNTHPNMNNNHFNANSSNADAAAALRQFIHTASSPGNNNGHAPAAIAAATTSATTSATATATAAANQKKKINPKLAKKYAGRGLKTITVSGPGLPPQRFKICVGDHPEDVKKWIEERRKRFPRSGGGAGRKEEEEKKDGKGMEQIQKRSTEEGEVKNDAKRQCLEKRESGKSEDEEGSNALSSLLAGYESTSSQEEESQGKGADANGNKLEDASQKAEPNEQQLEPRPAEEPSPSAENTLSHEPHEPHESHSPHEPSVSNTTNTNSEQQHPKYKTRICKYYQRGKCRHGVSCNFLHSKSLPTFPSSQSHETNTNNDASGTASGTQPHDQHDEGAKHTPQAKRKAQSERDKERIKFERELQMLGLAVPKHGTGGGSKTGKVINNTSLLLKLLQRDKERERRLTLQLLRYVVDCDFFQGVDSEVGGEDEGSKGENGQGEVGELAQIEVGKGDSIPLDESNAAMEVRSKD